MRRTGRQPLLATALLASVLGLAACGSQQAPPPAAPPRAPETAAPASPGKPAAPPVVRFGVQPSTQPPYIAREAGFFKPVEEKFGTRIEFVTFASGAPENAALAAGEIDFAQEGMAPAMVAAEKGGARLVLINILEQTALVSSPGIDSVKGLKGKAVAFPGKGSQQYPLLLKALEKEGLKESDVNLVKMDAVNMATALEKGEIAAYIAWDPHTTKALLDGKNKVLVRAEQVMPLKDGHYLGEGVVVREEFASKYPELTRELVAALVKTNAYIVENLDKVAPLWSKAIKLDEKIIRFSLEKQMAIYPKDVTPDRAALKPYVNLLKQYEILQVADVDKFLAQQVDTSFVSGK